MDRIKKYLKTMLLNYKNSEIWFMTKQDFDKEKLIEWIKYVNEFWNTDETKKIDQQKKYILNKLNYKSKEQIRNWIIPAYFGLITRENNKKNGLYVLTKAGKNILENLENSNILDNQILKIALNVLSYSKVKNNVRIFIFPVLLKLVINLPDNYITEDECRLFVYFIKRYSELEEILTLIKLFRNNKEKINKEFNQEINRIKKITKDVRFHSIFNWIKWIDKKRLNNEIIYQINMNFYNNICSFLEEFELSEWVNEKDDIKIYNFLISDIFFNSNKIYEYYSIDSKGVTETLSSKILNDDFYDFGSIDTDSDNQNIEQLEKKIKQIQEKNQKLKITKDTFKFTKENYQLEKMKNNVKKKISSSKLNKMKKIHRDIGNLGEENILNYEIDFLISNNKDDLANKVKIISKENEAAGYDILSYDINGNEKYIEVKTTTKKISKKINFYISQNEKIFFESQANSFIYFLSDILGENPKLYIFSKEEIDNINYSPINYKVTIA